MEKAPENNIGCSENIALPPMANDNDNHVPPENLDNDGLDSFPTGYQFLPGDAELICSYLRPKLMHKMLPPNRFFDVNLYKYSPQELSEMYPSQGEKFWFFFTERRRKYLKGQRPNRATYNDNLVQTGYWKATGPERTVMQIGEELGTRSALVYYEGKPVKGKKQPWIMHEFVARGTTIPVDGKTMLLNECVLCKIYKKVEYKKKAKGDESDDLDQVEDEDAVDGEQGSIGAGSEGSVSSVLMEIQNDKNRYLPNNGLLIKKDRPLPSTISSSLIKNTAGTSQGYAHMGYQHTNIGKTHYFPNNGLLIKEDRPLPSTKLPSLTNNTGGTSHGYAHMGYQRANIGKNHYVPNNDLLIKEDPPLSSSKSSSLTNNTVDRRYGDAHMGYQHTNIGKNHYHDLLLKEDPPLSSTKSSSLANNTVGTSHDYAHMGYQHTNMGNDSLPLMNPSAINGQSQYYPDSNVLQYPTPDVFCGNFERFDNFPLGPFEYMPLTFTGDLDRNTYMLSDNVPGDLFFATPLQPDEVGNQLSQRPHENGNQSSQQQNKKM